MSKVIMIGGLPGSGKSFLANALSYKINAVHLSSDRIRREMNNLGKYEPADKELVYSQMKEHLKNLLDKGKVVIVDSTFYKKSFRDELIEIVKSRKCKSYFILATANEETIKKRVSVKRQNSEANYEVYKKLKNQFEPISINYLEIETSQEDTNITIEKILSYCGF